MGYFVATSTPSMTGWRDGWQPTHKTRFVSTYHLAHLNRGALSYLFKVIVVLLQGIDGILSGIPHSD